MSIDNSNIPQPNLNDGKDRGIYCENRVFNSILARRSLWPKEVVSIKRPTKLQDRFCGVDMIIVLVTGSTIFVQIKSSRKEAQRFRRRHPEIPVIIGAKPESDILLRFIDIVKDRCIGCSTP